MESENQIIITKMWREAREARTRAHAPYSHFLVGSSILVEGSRIFTGCNVENASLGGSICAERSAAVQAVSAGFKEFKSVLVVTDSHGKAVAPCGICLQFLTEFCHPETPIVLATPVRVDRTYKLSELLPAIFTKEHL